MATWGVLEVVKFDCFTSLPGPGKLIKQMNCTKNINSLQMEWKYLQMDCKLSSECRHRPCEGALTGSASKVFGLAFRVGERSTWVWIAVITVSHERMVICIHFYI